MKFSIVVYAAPYSAEAAATAFNFTRSVLEQGHDIYRLFFFGDGVHNASRLSVVAQDENNLQQQWDQLIRDHGLDSVICVSSAVNRGIVDAQGGDAARNRQIARSRAFTIKLFLTSRGVPERNIEVVTQNQNFTLFGLLDDDQQADRRVRLTYE